MVSCLVKHREESVVAVHPDTFWDQLTTRLSDT